MGERRDEKTRERGKRLGEKTRNGRETKKKGLKGGKGRVRGWRRGRKKMERRTVQAQWKQN